MSSSSSEGNGAGSAVADSASTLFAYTVRRDGRTIAVLNAYKTPTGVTVDSEVFAITKPLDEPGIKRPFSFGSVDQARRFADDAIVAFEYLNCTVT